MGSVNKFNLVEKSEDDEFASSKEVLRKALSTNLHEVLVLGFNEDGHFTCCSNTDNKGTMLYLIEAFRSSLMSGDIDRAKQDDY